MAIRSLRLGVGLAVLAAALSAAPSPSLAQAGLQVTPVGTDTLHLCLDDAIGRALGRNPGLEAVAQRAHAADRTAAAAFRKHFGDVEAVAWASRYQDAQILRPISQDLLAGGLADLPFARDQVHYGLTFELPLFLGGKLLAGSRLARFRADEANALLEGTRWQVRANVVTLYAATQALSAAALAYGDEVASLARTRARIDLMVQQGKRAEIDLLKATDALEEVRARLAEAEAEYTHVRALLLALLDYPADQAVALDSLPDRFPILPADEADWDALVQSAAPVATAKLRVQEATSGKQLALADFLPKLSLRGNLLGNAGSHVTGTLETWELTLAASIPVFSGGQRVAAYQSATAAERAADLALRQTLLQQQAEIRGALAGLQAAGTALKAAHQRLAAANEAARIENTRYENGAGTIEDLLRARTRAAEAQASLAKAKGDVLGAAARINALVEREIIQ